MAESQTKNSNPRGRTYAPVLLAAIALNMTADQLRRMVQRGEFAGRIDATGHYYVDVEALGQALAAQEEAAERERFARSVMNADFKELTPVEVATEQLRMTNEHMGRWREEITGSHPDYYRARGEEIATAMLQSGYRGSLVTDGDFAAQAAQAEERRQRLAGVLIEADFGRMPADLAAKKRKRLLEESR